MTGEQLLGIREALGMSRAEFLRALGLLQVEHSHAEQDRMHRMNVKAKLAKWERESVLVPSFIADRATDLWLRRGGCGS